jgi:hypothetical protein
VSSRLRLVAAVGLAAAAAPARAEPEPELFTASLELRIGSVTAPFYTDALPEVSSEFTQARSMILGGSYHLSPALSIGGRLPAAPSTVRQPAGSYSDEKAFGNPELNADWRAPAGWLGAAAVHIVLRGALGIPLAEHGSPSSLLQNRVVALSSALDGWRNPELYEPGVIPLTATGRALLEPRPWGGELTVKLPVLVRVHDASLPEESETSAVGLVPHLELRALFAPQAWVWAELGGHLAIQAVPAVAPTGRSERSGPIQPGIEPAVRFHPGRGFSLSAGFGAALGGPLAGTYAITLALALER